MKPSYGIETIKAALDIVGGDRHWFKFGHSRFALLRRVSDKWQLHHTKLGISKDELEIKGYSESDRSCSRSIELASRPDGIAELLRISQQQDDGVFWVPAGKDADLPLKKAIMRADSIGCEIDSEGTSHAQQIERYARFSHVSGLKFGLQLSSGSKSIHTHIFLKEPVAIDAAVRLRRLFILALLGDPAVTEPHQPMRFPGFYRREKGNYQTLLSTSTARYSSAEIEQGLKSAFTDLDWVFPTTLSEEFWADLKKKVKDDLSTDEKRKAIAQLLSRGDDWYEQQRQKRAQRQQAQQVRIEQRQLNGEFDLVDAISQVEQSLDANSSFNNPNHNWSFSGHSHARGFCQFQEHQIKGRKPTNSAWLSQKDGKWVYHCPTCTNDKPISSFQYWLYERRGVGQMPTGKDWAVLAKEWLAVHGVPVPEPKRISALLSKAENTQLAEKPASKIRIAEQAIGPAHQAKARISKLREARNKLVDRLDKEVLVPLKADKDSAIKEARAFYRDSIEAGLNKRESCAVRDSAIKKARDAFKEGSELVYKPALKALRSRCTIAIEKAQNIRDAKPSYEIEAESAAAQLLKKQKRELAQWLPVARETDPSFETTGVDEDDIKRAKKIVFSQANAKVQYDRTVQNTGGAFDEATLESLLAIDSPIIVGGETGGGKTELATQATAYAVNQDAELTYMAIAPTQVLSVQVAERFEQKGLPMESTAIIEGKRESGNQKPKALPAESLWKVKGQKLGVLGGDEPEQWVPRVLSGILGDAADVNLSVLRSLARNTRHQFWMNADPSPLTVELIGELAGKQPTVINLKRQQAKEPVSVDWYSDGFNSYGHQVLGSGMLYEAFLEDALSGNRVLLLAGSVKKARALRQQLKKAGIRALIKNGRYTPKKQRLGFALAPEKAMESYDVVILTRLVETGLDLQKDFDAVYVVLSPKMQARSAYQFLSRSRSLLRGDTPKLCIYSPVDTLTGIEQLSTNYWTEQLKRDNKLYAGLMRGDTSKADVKLEAIEWAISYQARYKADAARQTYFRNDLLKAKLLSLGWTIDKTFLPNEASHISEILKQEIFKAEWLEATCTARGHRSISDYSEAYAEKLADPNEQGLILECKRHKLELSSLLPGAELEEVSLIYRLIKDERLLPQTLLWSAIALNPHSERMQQLLSFLSSTHLQKFETYGALEGLKKLRKSKSMLAFALAEILAGDPLIERVLNGDDVIHKYQGDVQQLAAKLSKNSNLINLWCRRHFGREFAWGEDAVSVVCKALDKLLGIKSAVTGQTTEQAKGRKARARNYRTAFSLEGQEAIAKGKADGGDFEECKADIQADFVRRSDLMKSAKQGWLNKIEEAESFMNRQSETLHTKTNTLDSIDLDFSVQRELAYSSPSPLIQPVIPDLSVDLRAKVATVPIDSLADDYYDASAWE